MAKGIDINGQLRGKRGGVVYYRSNGQQISRARNYSPKNPKTDAQLIQRAVTATIMQMYAAGKEIFDHSFEGKSVPGGSMRAFMSENMRMLRNGITTDLGKWNDGTYNDDEEALAVASPYRVVSPRAYGPTANPYIISKGTYKNTGITVSTGSYNLNLNLGSNPTAETTIAEWLTANNILEGDIITIVFLSGTMDDSSRVTSPELNFNFVRLVAKAPASATIVGKKVSDLFDVVAKGNDVSLEVTAISSHTFVAGANKVTLGDGATTYGIYAAGCIVSRDDSGVRSNSALVVLHNASVDPFVSVTAASLVESWKRAAQTDSSLILEGGNI